jgi:hypothetical protein
MFGPWLDRGTLMIFSRFDLGLSVLTAFTLMLAIAYSDHGWTPHRITAVSAILLLVMALAQRRRVVFGCAFAVVTGRFILAIFLGWHALPLAAAAIPCAAISWLLLRGADRN